jgi:cell wall-associated NlpC family hydrolase
MTSISEKIIFEAKKEIGYKEFPSGSNKTKFGEWFGFNNVAWCGIFVSYCYAKAGLKLDQIGWSKGFASCQAAVAHFKATEQTVTKETVVPGDIVFFDWNKDGKFDHTGIFLKNNNNGTFQSIEGNTAIGNDSNGGEVMERTRSFNLVEIFVHPKILNNQNQDK